MFIVAVDERGGISKDQKICWHYPEDFKFFKERTQNKDILIGYNTYKEIAEMRKYPEKVSTLLPGRFVMVLTNNHSIHGSSDVIKVSSLLGFNPDDQNLYVCGGKSLYDWTLGNSGCPHAGGYVTRIKKDYGCDTFFDLEMLESNFELEEIIKETDELRFEKWKRKQ